MRPADGVDPLDELAHALALDNERRDDGQDVGSRLTTTTIVGLDLGVERLRDGVVDIGWENLASGLEREHRLSVNNADPRELGDVLHGDGIHTDGQPLGDSIGENLVKVVGMRNGGGRESQKCPLQDAFVEQAKEMLSQGHCSEVPKSLCRSKVSTEEPDF